jgi:taurine--2-oxoglutarate transaminase
VFPGGLTYSGHPLAAASVVASIGIFKEEKIVENARALGTDVIGPELEKMAARHASIGEVRGLGVFWAIELVRNRKTRGRGSRWCRSTRVARTPGRWSS